MLLKVLKDKTFFSVASNVSNKGNIKCYPIEVKYIQKKTRAKEGVPSLYEDVDETANANFDKVYSDLCKRNL
jgi:hypothetical protein